MSNSYTKAAFDLTVTVAEADMLRRVIATVELIDDTEAGIDVREAHYTSLGPDFAALFPRSDEEPRREGAVVLKAPDGMVLAIERRQGRWRLVVYRDPLTGQLARAWVHASAVSPLAPPVDADAR